MGINIKYKISKKKTQKPIWDFVAFLVRKFHILKPPKIDKFVGDIGRGTKGKN